MTIDPTHAAGGADSVEEGDEHVPQFSTYLIGLALAVLLTAASFWAVNTPLIYGPGIPVALATLAVAQMGIHLVFFLHLTTAPDNINNALALAFGLLIVGLIVFGSVWIMAHMNYNLMAMSHPMG
ncbi:MAG TPA: cytochrome o ubiquinol oxidase subunit IV [Rhizomicrobium sp.]|nr:cytochrome o ubiquinol oxidase subunit IV [Rhizomicrobium sp.]HUB85125.1 cytochrome o ubiquinol oxidase subunit IV [Rhizomicrobium sp.]